MLYTLLKFLGLHNLKVIMNGNSGFKIETYFTLIARDLLTSLASQRSMKCVQFVLLHINYQVVKTLMYVRWKSAPYSML